MEAKRSFSTWVRSVAGLSLAASGASLFGTGVIAGVLWFAHAATTLQSSETFSVGPWTFNLPNQTESLLVAAAILLTLASVIQSLLAKLDAAIVKRRLDDFATKESALRSFSTRELMAERYLLEGWTGWISATVQAIGFSALLAWIGGPPELLGVMVAAGITIAIAVKFFTTAVRASENFLAAQRAGTDIRRRAEKHDVPTQTEAMERMKQLSSAVYRRDTETFRLSGPLTFVLSLGIMVAAIVPAFLTSDRGSPALLLIILFLWRQRVIAAVMALGPLAWTLSMWRSAVPSLGSEEDFPD
jgi:hypothetical protein